MDKPSFVIDIAPNTQSSLESLLPLSLIPDNACYHIANNFRFPLGIYNISVVRVCDKIIKLCQRLESYFKSLKSVDPQDENDDLMQEVIDYIELSLYAAAEHVDDIYAIASGFFENKKNRDKYPAYRKLDVEIKKHKWLIAAAANAIKHQQARIRMFSLEYMHFGKLGCLHGFFIEGVENGVVRPSSTFHGEQEIYSISAFAWEIIVFLLICSHELANFLYSLMPPVAGPTNTKFKIFQDAVIAAARLPNYTFGEDHPFKKASLHIHSSNGDTGQLESGLYGSIKNGWSRTSIANFGSFTSRFAGDGKTVSFKFAQPKNVVLHYWD